jgi:hypothetical protein
MPSHFESQDSRPERITISSEAQAAVDGIIEAQRKALEARRVLNSLTEEQLRQVVALGRLGWWQEEMRFRGKLPWPKEVADMHGLDQKSYGEVSRVSLTKLEANAMQAHQDVPDLDSGNDSADASAQGALRQAKDFSNAYLRQELPPDEAESAIRIA